MRRGTTPIITLEVDYNLIGWDVYVTIVNGPREITFTNPDVSMEYNEGKTYISMTLTQLQTLEFKANTKCEIQIRAYKNGEAVASDIETVIVERILKDGVINAQS